MTARTDLLIGIVFSRYDEVNGPEASFWFPGELAKEVLSVVSAKTLNMLSGEEHWIPRTVEIVTFPAIQLKGMIRFLQIPDSTKRGGIVNASITILFNDKDAPIFYKYHTEFEKPLETFSSNVLVLDKKKTDARVYLETFYHHQGLVRARSRAQGEG
jgi:hypothetical protein